MRTPAAVPSARAELRNPSGTAIPSSLIDGTLATTRSEYESIVRPPILTNAFGSLLPSLTPLPAATIIADTFISSHHSLGYGVPVRQKDVVGCSHKIEEQQATLGSLGSI